MPRTSAESQLQGSIASQGSLWIEGFLAGDVCIEGTLEVQPDVSIHRAQVRCNDLLLSGAIDADVVANGSVRIAAGARHRGNLQGLNLQASSGASLVGQLRVGAGAQAEDSQASDTPFISFQTSITSPDSYA